MNQIFEGLFEYEKDSDLDDFIDNIDHKSALKIIEVSIIQSQQKGQYTLLESYFLYKCLSKLKKHLENENIGTDRITEEG